jgi:Kef-type K+ transport system membrane component KefB
MPPLLGKNAESNDSKIGAGLVALHVLAVSLLMVLGKMFPLVCYRDEAPAKHRLALCFGMCPRGEVGASIIVISIEIGVKGPAITISMFALVLNLVLSGGFIGLVKILLSDVRNNGESAKF